MEIRVGRLSEGMAGDFLVRGFRQSKTKTDGRITDVSLNRLGGIIGWLTLFGIAGTKAGATLESAIDQTVEVGKSLIRREFENFLKGRELRRQRYETIMLHLARAKSSSWSAIGGSLEAAEGRTINHGNATELLAKLVKAGLVKRKAGSTA